jgi:hypothetical protein
VFAPNIGEEERRRLYEKWGQAVEMSRGWVRDSESA